MHAGRVVVAAAIVRDGRVLVARRRRPPAGGWEFPGGKVEGGESDSEALVRECREELGIGISVGARLPGEWPIGSGRVLRVYLAELPAGEPACGPDHDELRWLARAELLDVDWLPADLPAVAVLADGLIGLPCPND